MATVTTTKVNANDPSVVLEKASITGSDANIPKNIQLAAVLPSEKPAVLVPKKEANIKVVKGALGALVPDLIDNEVQGKISFKKDKTQMVVEVPKMENVEMSKTVLNSADITTQSFGLQKNIRNTMEYVKASDIKLGTRKPKKIIVTPEVMNDAKMHYSYGNHAMASEEQAFINSHLVVKSKDPDMITKPTGLGFKGTWGLNGKARDEFFA
jgi:hypothetical protein